MRVAAPGARASGGQANSVSHLRLSRLLTQVQRVATPSLRHSVPFSSYLCWLQESNNAEPNTGLVSSNVECSFALSKEIQPVSGTGVVSRKSRGITDDASHGGCIFSFVSPGQGLCIQFLSSKKVVDLMQAQSRPTLLLRGRDTDLSPSLAAEGGVEMGGAEFGGNLRRV